MAAPTKAETEELIEQFETLRSDVNKLVSVLGDTAKTTANRTANELSEEINRISDELGKTGKKAYADAEDHITSNPFQSLLIALGVGFLIGALTRR